MSDNYNFSKLILAVFGPFRIGLGLLICILPYRFLWVKYTKLGHLLVEIDGLLKDIEIGGVRKRNWILLYDRENIANPAFIDLIPSFIHTIQVPTSFIKFSKLLLRTKITSTDVTVYCTAMHRSAKIVSLNSLWLNRAPTVNLPADWVLQKNILFENLGLKKNQNYVCIHARDSRDLDTNGLQHSARNVDIFSFTRVVKYLAKHNIVVFRMGDPSMPPLEGLCDEHDNLYDYAHMKCRAPMLDLVLSANCMFFVGTSSGASYMPTIFNRPLVAVGVSLPFNFCPSGFESDIGIPKLFRKIDTGDLCSFKEIFENGLSECRSSEEISQKGYELVENTEEEIGEVAAEMFERLSGSWSSTDFDEQLQHRVQSLILLGSYTYGSKSRCGSAFLRRYSHLIL
jgi:putative glycosyltransferase (TIGR04372 family)